MALLIIISSARDGTVLALEKGWQPNGKSSISYVA